MKAGLRVVLWTYHPQVCGLPVGDIRVVDARLTLPQDTADDLLKKRWHIGAPLLDVPVAADAQFNLVFFCVEESRVLCVCVQVTNLT